MKFGEWPYLGLGTLLMTQIYLVRSGRRDDLEIFKALFGCRIGHPLYLCRVESEPIFPNRLS